MSNTNPTISGYGFELDVNDISYSMFTNFIIAHEETIRSRTNYQEISLLEFIKKNRNADTITSKMILTNHEHTALKQSLPIS